MTRRLLILAACLALLSVSCGDSNGIATTLPADTTTTVEATTSTAVVTTTAPDCVDATSGPVFDVVARDNVFDPACLIVKGTQGLHMVNEGQRTHNFSVDGVPMIDVDVRPGEEINTESIGLAPGTYRFFCKYHESAGMVGELRVVE